MILGFRYSHHRHRGSVLPPIPIERADGGVRVLAPRPSWKEGCAFWVLVAMIVGLVLMLVFVAHPSRRLGGAISTVTLSFGIAEMGRRYYTQRRIHRATLLVDPWPLRLGERATVRFEKHLRNRAGIEGVTGRFVCREEATRSGGRHQEIRHSIRHEVVLDTSHAHIEQGRVVDGWEIEIPRSALPSFTVKSNKVQWRIETKTRSNGVEISADFELLVIPEEMPS